jgi:hypothetical protein
VHRTARPAQLVATAFTLGLLLAAACGAGATATNGPTFCGTMHQVTDLLEPKTRSTTPEGTKARYDSLSTLLAQAKESAPPALADDVATFATAIHGFATALAKVGYQLDAIFKTPEGVTLAADTSHALTPAIVDELTGPCGLDLGPPHPPN